MRKSVKVANIGKIAKNDQNCKLGKNYGKMTQQN